SDDGGGHVFRDDAICADAGRRERRLAAFERSDLLAAAPHADPAAKRVQTMSGGSRHVDRMARSRLEVLEPEVLAVDRSRDAGAHAPLLDDEVLGPSRREIEGFERAFDVEVAQRKTNVVPRAQRRPWAANFEREHAATFRVAERVHFGRSGLAAR